MARIKATAPRGSAAPKPKVQLATRGKKSTADSFVNPLLNFGIGTNNATSASAYALNPITRERVFLEFMYRGSWVIGVGVDAVAEDMTREGIDFLGTEDPSEIEQLQAAMLEIGFWHSVCSWIKWARLYGGCILVMLIDGQDPSTPLDETTIRKDQFKGFYPFERWLLNPTYGDVVQEMGPHLGKPKFYVPTGEAPIYSGKRIHWTRCMRMEGQELPWFQRMAEAGWGLSVVERVYDRLLAFDSSSTGTHLPLLSPNSESRGLAQNHRCWRRGDASLSAKPHVDPAIAGIGRADRY
jgi:uncharacterized protein